MSLVLNDGVSFHESPISENPLVLWKSISWEEAEARSPLNEDERSKWVKRQKNSKKIQSRLHGNLMHLIENPHLPETQTNVIDLLIGDDQRLLENLREEEDEDFWEIPINLVQMLSNDSNKLWESATMEQFQQNGKYNQISLNDDGKLFITIVKPGYVDSIPLQVPADKVEALRAYIRSKDNKLDWDKTWEWYAHWDSGLGWEYRFNRKIILLDNEEETIYLIWNGNHGEPLLEWGPFSVDDNAKIQIAKK